jgi:hypothetical protein
MDLHGFLSCAQLRGNLFVVQSPDQARGNLALSSRQAMHALDEDIIKPLLRFRASTLFEATRDGRDQLFRINRRGQEVDRAASHSLHDSWDITQASHENYGESAFALESSLQLEPRQAGEAVVENNARSAR